MNWYIWQQFSSPLTISVISDAESESYVQKDLQALTNISPKKDQEGERERLLKKYTELKPDDAECRQSDDEVSDFYLM